MTSEIRRLEDWRRIQDVIYCSTEWWDRYYNRVAQNKFQDYAAFKTYIIETAIYIRILANWQILTINRGGSIGARTTPIIVNSKSERRKRSSLVTLIQKKKRNIYYSVQKIYSKNFICHNGWNNTGEEEREGGGGGLICSNERSISNNAKRMGTDKTSSNIRGRRKNWHWQRK